MEENRGIKRQPEIPVFKEVKMMLERAKNLARVWASMLVLILMGILIGAVVSLAEVIFAKGLELSISFHQSHRLILTCLLPLIGLLVVFLFMKFGGITKRGMNLVFEVSQGLTPKIPKRTLWMVTLCTWISHIAGASVGREGVAVQIGATISNFISNLIPPFKQKKKTFLIIGMAAGFSGLFGTPFTAAFFALEVLEAGRLEMAALLPVMAASYTACRISSLFGITAEVHPLSTVMSFYSGKSFLALLVLGIVFGIVGGLFAWCLHKSKKLADKIFPSPYVRMLVLGVILAILLLVWGNGRYSNTGTVLFDAAFGDSPVYAWDWLGKFVITVLSLTAGFVGGEVTPLFAIGSCLGYVLGPLLGLPAPFAAALGYAAVFGAGTNTWLAAIMIGMELFGYQYFPWFFVVCSIAYILNHNQSIYSLQRVLYAKDMQPLKIGRSNTDPDEDKSV